MEVWTADPYLHNIGILVMLAAGYGLLLARILHRCTCQHCPHCADIRRREEAEQERLRHEYERRKDDP